MDENKKQSLGKLGFQEEIQAVIEDKCPSCRKQIEVHAFRDRISVDEFKISGLCQVCQDGIFGAH